MTGGQGSKKPSGSTSVPLFLAHSLELETDAMERYRDLSGILEEHNNGEVAKFFREMERYAALHVDEVKEIAKGVGGIPYVAPWDYVWFTPEPPEVAPMEDAHYLMTPRHVLGMAMECEKRARDYYLQIADETQDEEVKRLALGFAEEEGQHVQLLVEWLKKVPAAPNDWSEDLDGPRSSD